MQNLKTVTITEDTLNLLIATIADHVTYAHAAPVFSVLGGEVQEQLDESASPKIMTSN